MHHYPFHIGDYRSGCIHLTQLERWVYRDLLDIYYDTEQPLPLDHTTLFRLAGARSSEHKDAVLTVLDDKFVRTEAGYVNDRAQSEIDKYRKKADSARSANQKRWGSESDLKSDLKSDARTDLKSDADQIATKNQEPISPSLRSGDKPPRKRAAPPPLKPDDVDQQTWDDWLQLRKAKSAPVTETVLRGARSEAESAGMDLDAFLQVWCLRGSQGLQADWLRPDERKTPSRVRYPAETPYQAQQLAQAQALAPTAARRSAGAPQDFIDLEEMSHVHVHGIEGH